ncbi:MAG TPA: DUF3160 domain-containing protein [Anaerolineales bacterium]|nr:DUF3160 domain-containing protein [Anaerolineales bacterium]
MRIHKLANSLALMALFASACAPAPIATSAPTEPALPTPTSGGQVPGLALPVFAEYEEPAVRVEPAVAHEPIAADLSNVRVAFLLAEALRRQLAQEGFVVAPGVEKEFFTVYEKARYDNQPVFVTSDSLLHVYHLLFDKVLRTAETEHFIPLLRDLNAAMLAQVDAQYQSLKDGPWEEPARRTVAFVGVASKLLDPEVEVPAYAGELAAGELALIADAAGILPSPLFPGLEFGEDYTQYIPRGHYTRSEDLKRYFQSMMWYGRMTFRLKVQDPEIGRAETRSALLLVQALREAQINGRPALEAWQDLYSPTAFMVGRSDDLTALQYFDVMDTVYGSQAAVTDLVDEGKLQQFIDLAFELPPPRILGIVIMFTDDVEETTKGLRFMGQRFVPDAYVFRQLIFRNVGTLTDPRVLPKGLDLFAAIGSDRAYEILDEMGETHYESYDAQMHKTRDWMSGLTVSDWTETLYNTWLYTFQPLIEVPGDGYPQFMRSPSWLDKQLNTVLGSWAELKHDTILYAKQVYAELGGGAPPPEPEPPKGYVEPVPLFYARLAALTEMTRQGLESRGLLGELDRTSLDALETLARSLQTMAEKELRNEPLTEDEYATIRFYGGQLETLTMAAADSDVSEPYARRYMEEEPQAAVIADVATNPSPPGSVLEEAVGRVNPIYVVVPIVDEDGSTYLQVAKGGVFSYYEFPWPMDDRLTDEKWRGMLEDGTAPEPPAWTSSFLVDETEYADLSRAVSEYQASVTAAYWFRDTVYLAGGGAAAARVASEISAFAGQQRYLGHQLLVSQFRSFDLQSETLAVVTARETWQDSLYTLGQYSPDYGDTVMDQRGPYVLDATYTLEFKDTDQGPRWQVTGVVYAQEPPGFE